MQGKIIKGIAGFYYVYAEDGNTYECRAKGIFRKDKFKPLVGDNVEIAVLDEKELEGSVTEIHKRKNSLIRPAVANVDQALVIFAMDNPKPNFMLLDRFLIMMEREGVPVVICFNKKDLATTEELEFLYETYQSCGYQVILSSALKGEGLDEIEEVLQGRTTVVAGPSGVGKSSLINLLLGKEQLKTNGLRNDDKGRHTTTHRELFLLPSGGMVIDTPGMRELGMWDNDTGIDRTFTEIETLASQCKFRNCTHKNEPGCAVLKALETGELEIDRWNSYQKLKAESSYIEDKEIWEI